MSLTTDITSIVARADALIATFEARKAAIDTAVAAALAAAPSLSRTFYIDAVLGNDAGSGEIGAPLQTIARAAALTPLGGFGSVRLLSDVHVGADIIVDGKDLSIMSSDSAIRRRLTFERYADTSSGSPQRALRGFLMTRCGKLTLRSLTIEMPDAAGYEAAQLGAAAALIKPSGGSAGAFFTAIKISSCDVKLPVTPFGPMIDQYGAAPTALFWYGNTMTDQGPTGRLFQNFTNTAAGTGVAGLPWLVSNLATI